jgi:hypothetical protein
LFAVAVVLTYVLDLQNLGGVAGVGEPAPPLPEGDGDVQTVSDQTRNSLAALVAMGAIAVAVLVWTRRRLVQVPGTTSQPALESDIAPALDIATSHLLEGSDPRTSVLAAYASLESSLAKQGRQRELSETPTEHLARVLRELPQVSGPAVQLGRLYELARFSDHSITREDQLAAAQALDRARQDLRASSVVES